MLDAIDDSDDKVVVKTVPGYVVWINILPNTQLSWWVVKKLYIISTHRLAEYLTTYHSMFEPLLCNTELVKCEQLILYNLRVEDTPGPSTSCSSPTPCRSEGVV